MKNLCRIICAITFLITCNAYAHSYYKERPSITNNYCHNSTFAYSYMWYRGLKIYYHYDSFNRMRFFYLTDLNCRVYYSLGWRPNTWQLKRYRRYHYPRYYRKYRYKRRYRNYLRRNRYHQRRRYRKRRYKKYRHKRYRHRKYVPRTHRRYVPRNRRYNRRRSKTYKRSKRNIRRYRTRPARRSHRSRTRRRNRKR